MIEQVVIPRGLSPEGFEVVFIEDSGNLEALTSCCSMPFGFSYVCTGCKDKTPKGPNGDTPPMRTSMKGSDHEDIITWLAYWTGWPENEIEVLNT